MGGKGGGCAQGHTFQAWSLKLHSAVKQSSAILCPTCCTAHTGTTWPSVGVPTATSQRTCQPHTFRPTQRYCFWHHTNEVMCASNTHTCSVQLPACGAEQQTGNSFKDKYAHTHGTTASSQAPTHKPAEDTISPAAQPDTQSWLGTTRDTKKLTGSCSTSSTGHPCWLGSRPGRRTGV